jgi:hemolysin D
MKSAEVRNGTVIPLPLQASSARRAQLEFLPAAIEIVETPASPAGRAIAVTIILFFAVAIGWAVFGHVDIIATASGKIVPTGNTKLIQPFETGVVRAIHVQDGQSVKTGDVLVELDTTINEAERDRIAKELIAAQLTVARLTAAIAGLANPDVSFDPPGRAEPAQIELQRRFLHNQIEEVRAKLAHIDGQITQNEANRAAVAGTVEKLTLSIPLLRQRTDVRRTLADKVLGSKIQYWEAQQDLVEHEQELVVQRARLEEAIAATTALREQRRQTEAEYNRANFNDLADAQQKAASLKEALVQAEQRRQLQTLTAPVDGTVQQLAVHTVGGVVTPAQQVMVIVPAGARLEAEAMVSNRDIGFVHAGEPVEIKVDTFNFTRYGLIHGEVSSVSQDSIVRDKPADRAGAGKPGALAETSEPQGQELLYAARISLDRTQMQIDDKLINLSPGMAVTVEIKTGSRRIIEYLLSPLMRYKHESLRER